MCCLFVSAFGFVCFRNGSSKSHITDLEEFDKGLALFHQGCTELATPTNYATISSLS